jgi:hypothetical protein
MINNIPQFVQITGSGTINLSREGSETIVSIQGGAALAAGLVIQLDGLETPQFGDTFIMYYQATCTQGGGGSMTIFSAVPNIAEVWWGKPFMVTCFYNGSAWSSQVFVSADNSGWIERTDLVNEAVSAAKMETIADGSIFGGNAGGNAAKLIVAGVLTAAEAAGSLIFGFTAGAITDVAINAAAAIAWSKMAAIGSADIIVGDAFGVPTPVAMTGDVAIDNVGKTTIQPNAVDPSMLFVGGDLEAIVMDVHLSAALLSASANSMIIPFKGTAVAVYVYVDSTSVGDATFTVYLAGVPIPTGAAVVIAAASGVGTSVTQTFTAPNTFAANTRLNIGTSSTAAGGSCKVTVIVQKTL